MRAGGPAEREWAVGFVRVHSRVMRVGAGANARQLFVVCGPWTLDATEPTPNPLWYMICVFVCCAMLGHTHKPGMSAEIVDRFQPNGRKICCKELSANLRLLHRPQATVRSYLGK